MKRTKPQREGKERGNQPRKMVNAFRRSFSFPPPKNPRHKCRAPEKAYRVRSISLPCRPHAIISQLQEEIRGVKEWQSQPAPGSTSVAWLLACLIKLELLLASVDDVLRHPHTQDSLRHSSGWTAKLLEDFLRLADAHGTFRSALVALKQNQAEAQVAVRRTDEVRLASAIRCLKRTEKDLAKPVAAVRDVSKAPSKLGVVSDTTEAELAGIMREVTAVTASLSATVFSGILKVSSVASAAASSLSSSRSSIMRRFASSKKKEVSEQWRKTLDTLEGLQECIEVLDSGIYRVYRSLINARVSFLNSLTPTF